MEQIPNLIKQHATDLIYTRIRVQSVFLLPSLPCVPNLNLWDNSRQEGAKVLWDGGQEIHNLLPEFLDSSIKLLQYQASPPSSGYPACHHPHHHPLLDLNYVLILGDWDSDNGRVSTDKRSDISWINFIFIQLYFLNVWGVLHHNRNLVPLLLLHQAYLFPKKQLAYIVSHSLYRNLTYELYIQSTQFYLAKNL